MKFIFISPVFCPNDYMFERNIKSIESSIKFILPKVEIYLIGGYCAKQEYWEKIETLLNKDNTSIKIYKGKKNKGKAYNVNKMINYVNLKNIEYDYILTCDSDIIFIEDIIHYFKKLNFDNHGIIALNQLEHSCHIKNNLEKKIELHNGIKIKFYYSPNGTHIAGGCWFIKREAWLMSGGYKVFGVYCSDDATLLKDISNLGFKVCICDNLKVIHPFDNNKEYAEWKYKTSLKILDLEEAIKESDKFWKNNV